MLCKWDKQYALFLKHGYKWTKKCYGFLRCYGNDWGSEDHGHLLLIVGRSPGMDLLQCKLPNYSSKVLRWRQTLLGGKLSYSVLLAKDVIFSNSWLRLVHSTALGRKKHYAKIVSNWSWMKLVYDNKCIQMILVEAKLQNKIVSSCSWLKLLHPTALGWSKNYKTK